jgi:AraC-like DNA-binding protein
MPDRLSVFDEARVARSAILEVELPTPWCVRVPASDDTYFYVVRQGACCLQTEDMSEPLILNAGDMVTLVAGQAHLWRDSLNTPPRPTHDSFAKVAAPSAQRPRRRTRDRTRLLILSAPRKSNQFVSVYPALVAIPRTERVSHALLDRIIQLIELEQSMDRPGKDAVMRRLAELTVIELVRFALPRLPAGGRNWLGGLTDKHIGRAIAAMHADPGRDWGLRDLAAEVGMSRAVFVDRFTRLVGEPPHRYLRRIRVHRAALELEKGDEAIIRIAEMVGYASESSFNKAFSREMGITPARYRRVHR